MMRIHCSSPLLLQPLAQSPLARGAQLAVPVTSSGPRINLIRALRPLSCLATSFCRLLPPQAPLPSLPRQSFTDVSLFQPLISSPLPPFPRLLFQVFQRLEPPNTTNPPPRPRPPHPSFFGGEPERKIRSLVAPPNLIKGCRGTILRSKEHYGRREGAALASQQL